MNRKQAKRASGAVKASALQTYDNLAPSVIWIQWLRRICRLRKDHRRINAVRREGFYEVVEEVSQRHGTTCCG
jgi:hypothetical protein